MHKVRITGRQEGCDQRNTVLLRGQRRTLPEIILELSVSYLWQFPKLFLHLLIHSATKYLLLICHISGTVLGSGHTKMNKGPPSLGNSEFRGVIFRRKAWKGGKEGFFFFNGVLENEGRSALIERRKIKWVLKTLKGRRRHRPKWKVNLGVLRMGLLLLLLYGESRMFTKLNQPAEKKSCSPSLLSHLHGRV